MIFNDQPKLKWISRPDAKSKPAHRTHMQYAKALFVKNWKGGDTNDESTSREILIKDIDRTSCRSLWKYIGTHPHADVTNIFL